MYGVRTLLQDQWQHNAERNKKRSSSRMQQERDNLTTQHPKLFKIDRDSRPAITIAKS